MKKTSDISKCSIKRNIVDPYGNKFTSKKEMCRHYGITRRTLNDRLKRGYSMEDALTRSLKQQAPPKRGTRTDHLGNTFRSKKEMCNYYGINCKTFDDRVKNDYSMEDALTKEVKHIKPFRAEPCKDHLGNMFNSVSAMCIYYGISLNKYKYRQNAGWSLEETLTRQVNSTRCSQQMYDHLGNEFKSQAEMCDYWRIKKSTFRRRIKMGWTLEDALTKETLMGDKCIDHLGNEYNSYTEMAAYYKKDKFTLVGRIKNGWSIRQALLIPQKNFKETIALSNKSPLIIINKVKYYAYKCPICKKEFVFSKNDVREHYADHIEKGRKS